MKVKLKDGRTGTLIQKGDKVSHIQTDPSKNNPGGIEQIANTDFTETGSATAEEIKQPVKKEDADKGPKQPGVTEVAGNAALLTPVFVAALIEALQNPDVVAALKSATASKKKGSVKKTVKKKK